MKKILLKWMGFEPQILRIETEGDCWVGFGKPGEGLTKENSIMLQSGSINYIGCYGYTNTGVRR